LVLGIPDPFKRVGFSRGKELSMAIPVVGFDNVQSVEFSSPSGTSNHLYLITGVAKIEFSGSASPDSDDWTRDTCSFDLPTPDGQPFLFGAVAGAAVRASALVVPATVQNRGSADIGFGVDHCSAVVSEPINGQPLHKVTVTSLVVTRNPQGIVWRLAFQVNVNGVAVASQPQVHIQGPLDLTAPPPGPKSSQIVTEEYSLQISNLQPPLMIQWAGGTTVLAPNSPSTQIQFDVTGDGPGQKEKFPISVFVTDQLGVSASDQQMVMVTVTND
jgi:hypothetical protein